MTDLILLYIFSLVVCFGVVLVWANNKALDRLFGKFERESQACCICAVFPAINTVVALILVTVLLGGIAWMHIKGVAEKERGLK